MLSRNTIKVIKKIHQYNPSSADDKELIAYIIIVMSIKIYAPQFLNVHQNHINDQISILMMILIMEYFMYVFAMEFIRYDQTQLHKIYRVLHAIVFKDITEGKVSISEFYYLLIEFDDFTRRFKKLGKDFDPNLEADHLHFLNFLKKGCKVEILCTLKKLGADYDDCMLPVFEAADAGHYGRHSLLWMAAKSMNYHKISSKRVPPLLEAVIIRSKKYSI